MTNPRFRRLTETNRRPVQFEVDGHTVPALEGDTILVAVLLAGDKLRQSEFGDGPRAGFCLMGACQDCWMWTAEGLRLRACGARVTNGMRLLTTSPKESSWPNLG